MPFVYVGGGGGEWWVEVGTRGGGGGGGGGGGLGVRGWMWRCVASFVRPVILFLKVELSV